ncbi:GntR family transcriptional regulator [Cobetia sp. L2A1]|uniref:GntR family transcriptional regulator n=1 Tax=Cobetia sp. L2A1 TaxID=2686360 RepID=UPI00131B107E|nr:FCD domain-containing protein [Cobetia sp. L2A1]
MPDINVKIPAHPSELACPVSSESMTNRVYHLLRNDIICGALPPGEKLKIEGLRKRYDVGASPIREALSLLTSEHFVERLDQRGFRVSQVSLKELDELLKTRCWLEERALRESITNGDKHWEEQIVLATYRLTRLPRSATSDHFETNADWERQHRVYHMTILSACGSSILLKLCELLYDQNYRYRQLSGVVAYPTRDIKVEHEELSDAILARDADLAVSLMLSHYNHTGDYLKESLPG